MSATIQELNRNRDLLEQYKEIPTGQFGSMIIQQKIKRTEQAISDGNVIALLRCYNELKESK